MLDFTIQNVLIAVGDDYATVDVQIVDGALAFAKPLVEKASLLLPPCHRWQK